jgi:hypothetical protein
MEQTDGYPSDNYRRSTTTSHTWRRVTPIFAERRHSVPRLGDIWVLKSPVSPNHFSRLYIPGVEDMFEVGDRIIRVEHGGSRFRLISWRVWRNSGLKWQFQQESTDEQCFFIFPSSLEPLIPIAEGAQSEFDG